MKTPEYEGADESTHVIRERALKIGGGVLTFAALAAAGVWYEQHYKRRKRLLERYREVGTIFEWDNEKPGRLSQIMRSLTAASLSLPQGATLSELRRQASIGGTRIPIGDGMKVLLGQGILEKFEVEGSKYPYFRPSPAFIAIMLDTPEEWVGLLELAKQYDNTFEVEVLSQVLQGTEFVED